MTFAAATAFGIGAVEHNATQVSANRVTPAKADYGSLIISGSDNFWALNGP